VIAAFQRLSRESHRRSNRESDGTLLALRMSRNRLFYRSDFDKICLINTFEYRGWTPEEGKNSYLGFILVSGRQEEGREGLLQHGSTFPPAMTGATTILGAPRSRDVFVDRNERLPGADTAVITSVHAPSAHSNADRGHRDATSGHVEEQSRDLGVRESRDALPGQEAFNRIDEVLKEVKKRRRRRKKKRRKNREEDDVAPKAELSQAFIERISAVERKLETILTSRKTEPVEKKHGVVEKKEMRNLLEELGRTKAFIQQREQLLAEEMQEHAAKTEKHKKLQKKFQEQETVIKSLENANEGLRKEQATFQHNLKTLQDDLYRLKELYDGSKTEKDDMDKEFELQENLAKRDAERILQDTKDSFHTSLVSVKTQLQMSRDREEKEKIRMKELKEIIRQKEIQYQQLNQEMAVSSTEQIDVIKKGYQDSLAELKLDFTRRQKEREDEMNSWKKNMRQTFQESKRTLGVQHVQEMRLMGEKYSEMTRIARDQKKNFLRVRKLLRESVVKELQYEMYNKSLRKVNAKQKEQVDELVERKYAMTKVQKTAERDWRRKYEKLAGRNQLLSKQMHDVTLLRVKTAQDAEKAQKRAERQREKETDALRTEISSLRNLEATEMHRMRQIAAESAVKLKEAHEKIVDELHEKLEGMELQHSLSEKESSQMLIVKDKYLEDRDSRLDDYRSKQRAWEEEKRSLEGKLDHEMIRNEDSKNQMSELAEIADDMEKKMEAERKRRKRCENELRNHFENLEMVKKEAKKQSDARIARIEHEGKQWKERATKEWEEKLRKLQQTIINQDHEMSVTVRRLQLKQKENAELLGKVGKLKKFLGDL